MWSEAIEHFELTLLANPSDAVLAYNAGLAAVGAQQTQRAVELFSKSTSLNPSDVAVHIISSPVSTSRMETERLH